MPVFLCVLALLWHMRVYVYTLACWFEIALRSQSASLGSVLNDIKGCKRAGIISACQWQNDDKSKKLFYCSHTSVWTSVLFWRSWLLLKERSLIMIMITDFNDDGASLCIIITIQDDHNGFAAQSRARSQLAPSHARGLHWIPGGGIPSASSLTISLWFSLAISLWFQSNEITRCSHWPHTRPAKSPGFLSSGDQLLKTLSGQD